MSNTQATFMPPGRAIRSVRPSTSGLAHPGGNITGTSWFGPELGAKLLELMKEALPKIGRVAVLREASAGAASVAAVHAAARRLGVVPSIFAVRDPDEFRTHPAWTAGVCRLG